MTRVGFLGVGAMGLPMAARLSAGGFTVRVADLNAIQVSKAGRIGLDASKNPDDLADCDVLLIVVATGDQLLSITERSLLNEGTLVRTVVVLSTVGIPAVQLFADILAGRGLDVIDAPMTGGVAGAESGALTFFVAAPAELIDRVRPLLAILGRLVDCGARVGDGQAFKLVNQLLAASHLAIAGEAIAFSRALGLDPTMVLGALTGGAGNSWMLTDRGPRMIMDATDRPTQTHLSIFVKDTALVEDAATHVGFDARILRQVASEFRRAEAAGLSDNDDSSVTDIDHGVESVHA